MYRNLTLSPSVFVSLAFTVQQNMVIHIPFQFFRVLIAIQSFIKIKLLPTVSSLTHSLARSIYSLVVGAHALGIFERYMALLLLLCSSVPFKAAGGM
jgi:hypothetical protein